MSAFPEVSRVKYEGPESDNPLAFRWYNPEEVVAGKTMKEHLRFTVVYWHTFRGTGSDPFGGATMHRPWDDGSESVENACNELARHSNSSKSWTLRSMRFMTVTLLPKVRLCLNQMPILTLWPRF